jgi:hypothetical protein
MSKDSPTHNPLEYVLPSKVRIIPTRFMTELLH